MAPVIQSDSPLSNSLIVNPITGPYIFCVGMGIQACWSSILNSLDFFGKYYPKNNVNFTFPIAVYTAQFLVTIIMTTISSHIKYTHRVIFPFMTCTAILAFLPFEAILFEDTLGGYWFIMGLLFLMGFSTNIIYSSMVGITSRLPGRYTTYFLMGSGTGSLSLSIVREIISVGFPKASLATGIIAFYIVAALIIVTAILLHLKFVSTAFYRKFLLEEDAEADRSVETNLEASLNQPTVKVKRDWATVKEAFGKIKLYPFLVGLTFIQMFAVFPGVMLMKNMKPLSDTTKLVSLNFTFSIFFIAGKKLGQFRSKYTPGFVIGVVMFRFILVAFFILQALYTTIPIISSIWFAYVNVVLFALTTGFCNCAIFILGPENLPAEKKEVAGFINVFGLGLGTLIGVFVAYPMSSI